MSPPPATLNLVSWLCEVFHLMADKKEKVVHCWEKTGLLGAWLKSNQILAVTRASELFPNLATERRGLDDAPPPDPEPDTDVGAPVDQPADLPVQLPSGAVHRPANDNELLEAASWIDWNAAEGAAGM